MRNQVLGCVVWHQVLAVAVAVLRPFHGVHGCWVCQPLPSGPLAHGLDWLLWVVVLVAVQYGNMCLHAKIVVPSC